MSKKKLENKMKKLLIGLLLVGSFSSHATEVICEYGSGSSLGVAVEQAKSLLNIAIEDKREVSAPSITATQEVNKYARVSICVTVNTN